jgi:hypothetical protein
VTDWVVGGTTDEVEEEVDEVDEVLVDEVEAALGAPICEIVLAKYIQRSRSAKIVNKSKLEKITYSQHRRIRNLVYNIHHLESPDSSNSLRPYHRH